MQILFIFLGILVAYLVGSIPTSFIFARLLKGVDIRKYGSGNVGATNLSRVAGKLPAVFALILDVCKGVIAVTLVPYLFIKFGVRISSFHFKLISGMSAIAGHIWPVFLGFKGGKGVATSAGVLMVMAPKVLGFAFLVWIITVVISKYVSLGSIFSSISLVIIAAVLGEPFGLVVFCAILCLVGCYKHKSNIKRLIRGEEMKIGRRVKT